MVPRVDVRDVAVSSTGGYVACLGCRRDGAGGAVLLWDAETEDLLLKLDISETIGHLAMSPDMSWLVLAEHADSLTSPRFAKRAGGAAGWTGRAERMGGQSGGAQQHAMNVGRGQMFAWGLRWAHAPQRSGHSSSSPSSPASSSSSFFSASSSLRPPTTCRRVPSVADVAEAVSWDRCKQAWRGQLAPLLGPAVCLGWHRLKTDAQHAVARAHWGRAVWEEGGGERGRRRKGGPLSLTTANSIALGDRVVVRCVALRRTPGWARRRGTVKYIGPVSFAPGIWFGVVVDGPDIDSDRDRDSGSGSGSGSGNGGGSGGGSGSGTLQQANHVKIRRGVAKNLCLDLACDGSLDGIPYFETPPAPRQVMEWEAFDSWGGVFARPEEVERLSGGADQGVEACGCGV